ncbi:MAG TPA: hypothetical protein VF889_10030, partial [Bacteroidota bacterium]
MRSGIPEFPTWAGAAHAATSKSYKRTATVAALFMLSINGQQVTWDDQEALSWIVAIAEGKQPPEAFAA